MNSIELNFPQRESTSESQVRSTEVAEFEALLWICCSEAIRFPGGLKTNTCDININWKTNLNLNLLYLLKLLLALLFFLFLFGTVRSK